MFRLGVKRLSFLTGKMPVLTRPMPMVRLYATQPGPVPKQKKKEPRIRYLFYMFVLSSLTVFFGAKRVDRKKTKTSFGSEQELDEYEQLTGIKRRNKLIPTNDKYKFYSVPYAQDDSFIETLGKSLGETKLKVIDPQDLIEREINDESRRYSFLLQDLRKNKKPLPTGLLTAILKNEIQFYLNTSQGIYDTNFILKNYPQNTNEASKFETDIASFEQVLALKDDILKNVPSVFPDREARAITNVVSYFETVDKAKIIESLSDL